MKTIEPFQKLDRELNETLAIPRNMDKGDKFGRLTTKTFVRYKGQTYAYCICDCGKESRVNIAKLKTGNTKSCGCLRKEILSKTKSGNTYGKTHGLSGEASQLANLWSTMKARCSNPNTTGYKTYGGRGITVCKEWQDFANFYLWALSNGYEPGLTIDRVNNDSNYEPSNCRWLTRSENSKAWHTARNTKCAR